jgi:hypothetical protein
MFTELSLKNELWLPIANTDDKYYVSNLGRVISTKFNKVKFMTPSTSKKGYLRVTIKKDNKFKTTNIHGLVAQAFIPNPNKLREVNHTDGVKSNNEVINLEWTTRSENMIHAYSIGLKCNKGSKNTASKLTEEQVREIRATYKNRDCNAKVFAERYGIVETTLHYILSGKLWSHIN